MGDVSWDDVDGLRASQTDSTRLQDSGPTKAANADPATALMDKNPRMGKSIDTTPGNLWEEKMDAGNNQYLKPSPTRGPTEPTFSTRNADDIPGFD